MQLMSLAMRKPVNTLGIQQMLRSDCSLIHTMNPYLYMGEMSQDKSWIQDSEADFP